MLKYITTIRKALNQSNGKIIMLIDRYITLYNEEKYQLERRIIKKDHVQ